MEYLHINIIIHVHAGHLHAGLECCDCITASVWRSTALCAWVSNLATSQAMLRNWQADFLWGCYCCLKASTHQKSKSKHSAIQLPEMARSFAATSCWTYVLKLSNAIKLTRRKLVRWADAFRPSSVGKNGQRPQATRGSDFNPYRRNRHAKNELFIILTNHKSILPK